MPFTAELLPCVQPWFLHPEVRHRLGGPDWPARELRRRSESSGEWFRGRKVLRAHSWVLLDDHDVPVAKIGGDVYDRWTRYLGEGRDGPRIAWTEPARSMALAYVVDPARWRTGIGRRALQAVLAHPAVTDVELFVLGIDSDNWASRACAAAAGFTVDDPEPDFEDTVYHSHRPERATEAIRPVCADQRRPWPAERAPGSS